VFNHALLSLTKSYVLRIGRAGRRSGFAIALSDAEQRAWLRDVEREIGRTPIVQDHLEWRSETARRSTKRAPRTRRRSGQADQATTRAQGLKQRGKLAARMVATAA
jgi:ATP-dependent RNA helicase RhlE